LKKALTVVLLMTQSFYSFAEYRVYQYLVKTNDPYASATRAKAQYIVSTLNPQMYKSYHGGQALSVDLLRTWMCPGYTGKGTRICSNPYDKENSQP